MRYMLHPSRKGIFLGLSWAVLLRKKKIMSNLFQQLLLFRPLMTQENNWLKVKAPQPFFLSTTVDTHCPSVIVNGSDRNHRGFFREIRKIFSADVSNQWKGQNPSWEKLVKCKKVWDPSLPNNCDPVLAHVPHRIMALGKCTDDPCWTSFAPLYHHLFESLLTPFPFQKSSRKKNKTYHISKG